MKYKARIEKLDWKGNVKVSFRVFEDDFDPHIDEFLEDFIKTGKINLKRLSKPDINYWKIEQQLAPVRSRRSFRDHEPGLRAIAGEYIPSAGIQYIVQSYNRDSGWVERESDVLGD